MSTEFCPICNSDLEPRDVTPCDDCGGCAGEIEHFLGNVHTYAEYEVFPTLTLVLCNFCDVDFGSYRPDFFGLPATAEFGYEYFRKLRDIASPVLGRDLFCAPCNERLTFLRFILAARTLHAGASNGADRQP